MITQTIDLNMIPDSPPVIVHVDQYDHGAGRIIANLYNGDQLYTPSNATAWIQGTKPDGRGFQYSATLSGSTVTAELTEQMTAVAGNVRTQIVINETNGRIGTFCFTLAVQKSGLPADTDMSQSEYQIVEELIEEVIGASSHAPIIGQNGNWWIWDVTAGDYVDSGVDASITVRIADVTMLEPNAAPYVTNTGTDTDPIFHLYIPRGYTGNGIASITKTSSVGLVDTYTITYTNGTTTTFDVTNGASGVGGGSTVVVTVNDSSFYGKSVSITDGNATETATFDNSGRATFTGLSMTGNLTVSSNNGSSTATTMLSAPYFGNYTVALALWSATIDISVSSSALNGLTVYAKKNGVTYGSATIVNGAASINVSEAGTYSIECTLDWNTYSTNVVVSAETTYSATLTTFAATVNLTTPNSEFYGESIAVTVDGTPITGTAFSGSGTATFTALRTGMYVFSITYGGQSYTATVTVSAESTYSAQIKMWNATISISTTSASLYGNVIYVKKSGTTVASATFDNTGAALVMVHETGTYTVETTYGGWTYSAEVVVSAETTYSATLNTFDATLSISTTSPDLYGQTITIKKGSTTIGTTTFSSSGAASYTVHETGTYTCEVTVSGQIYTESATVSAETTYNVTINTHAPIYGAEWDGTSDPAWTRTDAATSFVDPNPYYAGMTGTPSSPFDNISPWKDMVISEDSEAGTLVSIPKFYYKWTQSGSTTKLQISMSQHTGFLCSPAHADRGDGQGERDWVYVGAYPCASDYKSKTGVVPLGDKTRDEFRTGIHNLGNTIWQWDYAVILTIRMLYIVEFAHNNSQAKIGYGCGSGTPVVDGGTINATGSMDNIAYHTGTNATSRTAYGNMKYRHITALWDDIFMWADGIRYDSNGNVYYIKNPSQFSDTSNGIDTGFDTPTGTGNLGMDIAISSVQGCEGFMWIPHTTQGDDVGDTYMCDRVYSVAGSHAFPYFCAGYRHNQWWGIFNMSGADISTKYNYIGSRLMKLP